MPATLALTFEPVDAASVVLTADVVRLLRQLTGHPVTVCDVGIDRRARCVHVRASLPPGELAPAAAERLAFWAARARGRVRISTTDEHAAELEARLASCEYHIASAGLLHAAAAIQAIFRKTEHRPSVPLDEPVLVLHVGGASSEGFSYDAARQELFVSSALRPPAGDLCTVQLVAPRSPPVFVAARVTDQVTAGDGAETRGFVLALKDASADALLRAHVRRKGTGEPSLRRAQRHRVHGEVQLRDAGAPGPGSIASPERLFLRDLSSRGAFVRTQAPRRVGERVLVEARLPNGVELSTCATVVHSRADGMGLQFDEDGTGALVGAVSELEGRAPRILLIDDDALVREMLSDALREKGYDVVTAADGALGLHTVTDQLFTLDLLITDVAMKGIDGEALVRTIRQAGGEADLPILVVTGSSDDAVAQRLRALGASEVVLKSEGVTRVVAVTEALLERRGAARAASDRPAAGEPQPARIGRGGPASLAARRC